MSPEMILFALSRSAVCGTEITEAVKKACTPDVLAQVYILARKHDIAHLAGHMLGGLHLPDCEPLRKMKDAAHLALYRYMRLNYEYERICNVLEQAQIPFIPLKGSVVRRYYPEPWMRTSCDLDILVYEEDLERATDMLVSCLSYSTDQKKRYHDMSLFSDSGIHLELHFSIRENMENIDRLLCQVWDYATPVTGYRYELDDTFLVFHLLAHMSYHFTGGGCGIRSFLDIFLLQDQNVYDEEILRGYLAQCGIEKFYDGVLALIGVWFQGEAHTDITEKMQKYLLKGGTYGNKEQRIAIQQKRKGGKVEYMIDRIFMPYRILKIKYRILEKYPILYPVMLVWRWIEMVLSGKLERSVKELDMHRRIEKKQAEDLNELLVSLGL